ncbi:4-hydroxy-2-oxo-heptane-1,7-dioate aldolase [Lampropedia puyangensis]|uniref:4-hydroxy-2-oxo-heptane-1,7-dioate aldolase n=1 Tax=Lampropedia puyangensis TaxID=1330072 RepID=A0A4S8FBK4_9BURK|nr:aldolase/citrate lyase family protein [Lampropedia puyangensis]THU05043.1 4-hydroxy-2-oxo-heptane-1,7-dioate aldolase [Lampropedia puyangensis]
MTLPINHFKQSLLAGKTQIGLWSTLPSPYISELIAGCGFDWLLLDTEHTPTDVTQMMAQLQAVAGAIPMANRPPSAAVVRPAWNDPVLIKRYLDIGAQSLLLPFVQNATEAHAAVAAVRYPTQGMRGMGGSVRASNFGRISNYIQTAHEQLCVLVQIETAQALANLDEIADVDGVDGIFIGPADLSASLGYAGNPRHPEVDKAINDAIVRIRAKGKAPGILMVNHERAQECITLGAQFVAVAADLVVLREHLDQIAAKFSGTNTAAERSSY